MIRTPDARARVHKVDNHWCAELMWKGAIVHHIACATWRAAIGRAAGWVR